MPVFDAPAFELSILDAPHALHAVSFRGREAISRTYRFDILAIGPEIDAWSLEADYLGQRARLRLGTGDEDRVVTGVISRIEAEGAAMDRSVAERHGYRLRLVPALWLLGRGKDSRIFQDRSVPEIACAVLGERGVRVRLALGRVHDPRAYCLQYDESDLAFVERLLREEGLYYFFDPPEKEGDDEVLVIADDAGAVAPIAGDATLAYREQAMDLEATGTVQRFRLSRRVAAGSVLLKDFDFTRPSYANSAQASAQEIAEPLSALLSSVDPAHLERQLARRAEREAAAAARRAAAAAEGLARDALRGAGDALRSSMGDALSGAGDALRSAGVPPLPGLDALGRGVIEPWGYLGADEAVLYDHHREHDTAPFRIEHARVLLEQERRGAWIGSATSRCRRLAAGRRFDLVEAPIRSQNGAYTVFEVQHRGQDPAFAAAGGGRPEVYTCELRCVPASVPFRPRPRRRKVQQVLETAIVVGPAGQEIHTDAHGRVKVRFHWQRGGAGDERSSCWIRVQSPWAGGGFGAQFLPRVGTEVTVGFLGGDVDRPVVLGALHNAERPPPFSMPRDKTKSGFVTESTRGGGGHNELSFEDRKGFERVHVRAEKDLDVLVRNNETRRVENNQVTNVGVNQYTLVAGNRMTAVGGDDVTTVAGKQQTTVERDRTDTVQGDSTSVVAGNASERFAQDLHVRVEGRALHEVRRDAELRAQRDLAVRVLGNCSVVVGDAGERRSSVIHTVGDAQLSCDERLVIQADKGIEIVCGRSVIAVSKERITLCSPEIGLYAADAAMALGDKKARIVAKDEAIVQSDSTSLRGQVAAVELTADAIVRGSAINLLKPSGATDTLSGPARRRLTKIELTDQDGQPLAFQRFVIRLADGDERVGVLDEHGRAEMEIAGGGEATIWFPDVANVEAR
jgi:type VI secretion system secreted protein VgrG